MFDCSTNILLHLLPSVITICWIVTILLHYCNLKVFILSLLQVVQTVCFHFSFYLIFTITHYLKYVFLFFFAFLLIFFSFVFTKNSISNFYLKQLAECNHTVFPLLFILKFIWRIEGIKAFKRFVQILMILYCFVVVAVWNASHYFLLTLSLSFNV